MGLLTKDIQSKILSWLLINSTFPVNPPTQPVRMHLLTSNGTSTAAGTEVVGNSYEPETVSWILSGTPTEAVATNGAPVSFSSLDSENVITVVGIELWDSSTTPQRVAFASLDYPVSVGPGQSFTIATGQIKVKLI
ncbi:MAG: hypothetical protein E6R04_00060 [Spirochaetes bacterium]|nr:MAG: hypothetical protein E6R04_00060 [Spirochaetota bacterium]